MKKRSVQSRKKVRISKFIINPWAVKTFPRSGNTTEHNVDVDVIILEEFSVTVESLLTKGAHTTKFLLDLRKFLHLSEQDSTKRVQT